ncbi:MAG: zinc-dependent peptidase [Chryseolinea sp.]
MVSVIIISGAVVLILFQFKSEIKESYTYAGCAAAPVKTKLLPVPKQYKDILQKYFPYYQQLSATNKARFERKVCNFIYGKRFIPRNIDEVTVEGRVLIAATAVQLTFGLSNIYLRHFRKILVYPNDYYSSITKRFHKGEVNPMFGIIVLSWQSFVDGFIYPDNGKNLGLHEMAHALRLENIIRNEEYHFFDDALLNRLDQIAHQFCNETVDWSDTVFRPYACTNTHEFFAVAVENFFERSEQFKIEIPELYSVITKLLNQDPILMKSK